MFTFTKKYPMLSGLLALGGLLALAVLKVFQVHEAGGHIPIMAGIAFGAPMFMGDIKPMTLDEVQKAVGEKLQADLKEWATKTFPEMAKEVITQASTKVSDTINQIKDEVKALKESMKPEDVAKRLAVMTQEVARNELTKMTKEEDEITRAIVCAPIDFSDNRNKRAKEIVKELMDGTRKTDFMNIGTGSEGGNVVPVGYANAVAMLSLPASVVLQDADIIPFPAGVGSFKVPTGLGGPAFYYPNEGADVTASKGAFGVETIEPKLGACMVPISRQLLDFNNVGLVPYLAKIMGEASGKDIDYQIIAGGSSGAVMSALRDDGALYEHVLASPSFAITLDELLEAMGLLNIAGDHKWYFHPTVLWKYILSLKDDSGAKVFKDAWNQAPNMKRLLGYLVRECQDDVMYPASEANQADKCFGFITDMKQSLKVAIPTGIMLETSNSASFTVGATTRSAFQDNLTLIKMTRYLGAVAPDFSGGTPARYTGVRLVSKA